MSEPWGILGGHFPSVPLDGSGITIAPHTMAPLSWGPDEMVQIEVTWGKMHFKLDGVMSVRGDDYHFHYEADFDPQVTNWNDLWQDNDWAQVGRGFSNMFEDTIFTPGGPVVLTSIVSIEDLYLLPGGTETYTKEIIMFVQVEQTQGVSQDFCLATSTQPGTTVGNWKIDGQNVPFIITQGTLGMTLRDVTYEVTVNDRIPAPGPIG